MNTPSDPVLLVAGESGLCTVGLDGVVLATELEGEPVVSVAVAGEWCFAAVQGRGVLRRQQGGEWETLGLEGEILWTITGRDDGVVFAGVEPAAIWKLGDGEPDQLSALGDVAGAGDWESPWGPADLGSIVVDGDRLIVGIEIGGVAVSGDAGQHWEARNEGLFDDVHRVAADGSEMWATTGLGPHLSRDEGRSWSWEADGIDRGYTQGLALGPDSVFVSASSGPPSLWGPEGAEAAIFCASRGPGPSPWHTAFSDFTGNIDRQALAVSGSLVVAVTTDGELLVSRDGGVGWSVHRGLPPATSIALR